jgi:hypothetical protein
MPQLGVDDVVKSEAIELQVVPRIGTGLAGPGRPLFLTPRRFIGICKMVEAGARVTQACRESLVSYAGFRNHVARNPKYQKRLSKAEKIRDEVWKDYALEMIKQAMPKNWVAAMTYCERVYPNEFALRAVHRDNASADQPIGNEIPAERLAAYGQLMLEMARENEAKQLAQQENNKL